MLTVLYEISFRRLSLYAKCTYVLFELRPTNDIVMTWARVGNRIIVKSSTWQGLPCITIPHHDSLAALVQSAKDRCDLCRLVCNHIHYKDYIEFEDGS